MKTTILLSGILLSASSMGLSANEVTEHDQVTALDTVKVSADFRDLDLQQIPSAITVIGEDDIQSRNASHLDSILSLAPNVNFSSGASRGRFIQIRGIGERSQFVDPINPSVGLIIDGINMSNTVAAATLIDIEQVEILRGSQGTAFGANALAGLINIESTDQIDEQSGFITGSVGQYNSKSISTAYGSKISDNLSFRLSAHSNTSDGYIHNDYLNRDNTNNFDEKSIKANLKWEDKLSKYKLNIIKVKTDNGYDVFTIDNTRTTQSDEPGKDKIDFTGMSIQTSNSKNPNFTLESTTEISKSDSVYSYDFDWMNPGYRGNTDIDFESFNRDTQGGSFDIRLLSSTNSRIFDESTEWIAGIYTKQHEQKLINTRIKNDILKTDYNSKFNSNSAALYSELTSYLSNTTQISYGLRIEEWSSNHTDSNNFDRNKSETLYGGNISLNSTFDDSLIYANISRGYKAGGFNSDQSLDENLIEFDTEYNLSTELGIKSYLLGGALTTNIAVFYISRENMQTNNSYTPDDGDTYIIAINNAASGKNYGLEAESNYSINKSITFNASLGLLETEINDYTQPYTFIDISGRKQSHSPSYSFSTSLDFKITQNINSSIEIEGKDDFYFSDSHNAKSESYELLHASISYRMSNWDISLTGKNLTNKKIETRGFSGWVQDPQFYVDPATAYTPGKYTQFGEPRLITLQGRYSF